MMGKIRERLWVVGLVWLLSNTAGGFARAEDYPWLGRAKAERVVMAMSPDSTFSVLGSLFNSAKKSIRISVYQLDNPLLGKVLESALDKGVKVKILLEGSPIPKIPETELYIAKRLTRKGAKVYFYDLGDGRANRGFKYFHNKYAIVDGIRVAVGSGNYGNNGHPASKTFGNREWELVVDDATVAGFFIAAFDHDAAEEDAWMPYGSDPRYTLQDPDFEPDEHSRKGHYEGAFEPAEAFDVDVQTVFAPENALSKQTVLGALHEARHFIAIEQLNFETYWGDKPYNPDIENSPMMDQILARAREGVSVRILLNDDFAFSDPDRPKLQPAEAWFVDFAGSVATTIGMKAPRDNKATLQYLNKMASKERLDLQVKIIDLKNCGFAILHNKAMIVDGETTYVGSLNWGESAMKFNREAGLLLDHPKVAGYYGKAFDYDWRCSGGSED